MLQDVETHTIIETNIKYLLIKLIYILSVIIIIS